MTSSHQFTPPASKPSRFRLRDPLSRVPLRVKLPLAFVLMGVAAFTISSTVLAGSAHELLERQLLDEMDRTAAVQARMIGDQLELLRSRVEDFSSDGYIRRCTRDLQDPSADHASVVAGLRQHLHSNKLPLVASFTDVVVLRPDGRPLSGAHDELAPLPPIPPADGIATSSIASATAERPWPHFVVVVPMVERADQELFGRLAVVVRADRWLQSATGPETVPMSLAVALHGDGLTMDLPGPSTAAHDVPDESRLIFEAVVPGSRWNIRVQADRRVVLAPVQSLFEPFWVATGLVLLVGTLLLAVMTAFVLRPLSTLRDAAVRLERGEPAGVDPDNATRDEIGELTRSFHAMARALKQRTDQLANSTASAQAERDRLQAIISSMTDAVFILDSAGRVTLQNHAAEPLLIGLADCGDDAVRLICKSAGVDRTSRPYTCLQCLQLWRLDSHPCVIRVRDRTWEVTATSPLEAIASGLPERVYVARDISERVAQNERHAHQERMTVVGNLAAVVAHELNNPLSAIAMFSQMLEEAVAGNDAAREYAGVIRRNTDVCAASIRRLLDSSAQAPTEVCEFDLMDLLDDVVSLLTPLSRKSGVTVIVREPDEEELLLRGEERQLRQVFVNLVINAIQASGVTGSTITITPCSGDDLIAVDVTDSGPGIPADVQERLFQPFFTTKPAGVGTGLGLSTSRQIVHAHGGRLELVGSTPGETTFRVTLNRDGRADKVRSDTISRTAPSAPGLS